MALAVFVVANDVTALSVALPDIEKDFDADVFAGGMQWSFRLVALLALAGLVITVLGVGGPARAERRTV